MNFSFGSRELCKCLENLNFQKQSQKATDHVKFKFSKSNYKDNRAYITVQLGRKSFDKHSSTRYLRQIKNFGFTEAEIKKAMGRK